MKFHVPGFLAECPCFTYGRVHAAQSSALLYGFGLQASLGIGLWLLCRLGKAKLVGAVTILIGTLFWNAAVTLGVCCILGGEASGYDNLQMPGYMGPVLLWSYLMIAVCGILTYHRREERESYPSQWFVIAGLFWFAWIFSVASMVLFCPPTARGVVQASVAWWYSHNLTNIVLGFSGLASIFYFIPKILGRPLHSSYLAGLAFWTLALFGSWGGIPMGAPMPSWIPAMAALGTIFTIIPLIAVAINFCHTTCGQLKSLDKDVTLQFSYIALLFWFISSAQQIVSAFPAVGALTTFTWFTVAQKNLFLFGFFTMASFGAMYYILPRLLVIEPCPKLAKANFWLMLLGVLISYLGLGVGGANQGILLMDPANKFTDVMRATMMPVRVSSLGDLMIIGGILCFLLNFFGMFARRCCACCKAKKEACK